MDDELSEEQIRDFLGSLSSSGRAYLRDLFSQLAIEIAEARQEDSDVLFCGSNGETIIKCLHYPREVLGFDEPTLIPSGNNQISLWACSNEFVDAQIDSIKNCFPNDEAAQEEWSNYLNDLAHSLAQEARVVPPLGFENFLEF